MYYEDCGNKRIAVVVAVMLDLCLTDAFILSLTLAAASHDNIKKHALHPRSDRLRSMSVPADITSQDTGTATPKTRFKVAIKSLFRKPVQRNRSFTSYISDPDQPEWNSVSFRTILLSLYTLKCYSNVVCCCYTANANITTVTTTVTTISTIRTLLPQSLPLPLPIPIPTGNTSSTASINPRSLEGGGCQIDPPPLDLFGFKFLLLDRFSKA